MAYKLVVNPLMFGKFIIQNALYDEFAKHQRQYSWFVGHRLSKPGSHQMHNRRTGTYTIEKPYKYPHTISSRSSDYYVGMTQV